MKRDSSFYSSKIMVIFLVLTIFAIPKPVIASTFEIQQLSKPNIDRTWSDVTIHYNNHYHNYLELREELSNIEDKVPDLVDIEVIGNSYFGKEIVSVRITNELREHQKAKTLVVAHHHGREQITVEIALRFIIYLVNNYGINSTITEFIDTQEIYIVPTVLPTGYSY